MTTEIYFWIGFVVFLALMLAIDLGIFHRKSHTVTFKESLGWTLVWIMLAMMFAAIVYFWKGSEKAIEFITGYVIELSLSVDNLFIFILVFLTSMYLNNISTRYCFGEYWEPSS